MCSAQSRARHGEGDTQKVWLRALGAHSGETERHGQDTAEPPCSTRLGGSCILFILDWRVDVGCPGYLDFPVVGIPMAFKFGNISSEHF